MWLDVKVRVSYPEPRFKFLQFFRIHLRLVYDPLE